MSGPVRGFLALVALSVALGYIGREPGSTATVVQGAQQSDAGLPGVQATTGPAAIATLAQGPASNGKTVANTTTGSGKALACAAGRNGGRTDKGVSATEIRLASTMVADGSAASLLGDSPTGMKAVVDKVNAAGGICGRRLKLDLVNDGFDARLGHQYIGNFIAGNYFALAVVPSAEGLSSAISAGDIGRAGIPVVGTDGMRIQQYTEPWVWPVATATVSTMRIMAAYGYRERNAKTFAIVYDEQYKFGIEGKNAFVQQVKQLGGKVVAEQGLNPNNSSYASEVQAFNSACTDGDGNKTCDMVALLLLPDTAKVWLEGRATKGRLYTSGAQTLFTNKFAQDCVRAILRDCHGFAVWTGYNPPIGRYAGLPDVARYVDDVRTVRPRIDVRNQFLEGAYLGMSLLVEALRKVGPNLTRANLRATLDGMNYGTDLASKLSWRPGSHSANTRARAFSVVVSQSQFQDWADENTGWVRDPQHGG